MMMMTMMMIMMYLLPLLFAPTATTSFSPTTVVVSSRPSPLRYGSNNNFASALGVGSLSSRDPRDDNKNNQNTTPEANNSNNVGMSSSQESRTTSTTTTSSSSSSPPSLLSENAVLQQAPQRVMSRALPFMECPAVLVDCDFAGNVGFDPFGLSQSKEQLWTYREAEIKHARLAMLAAAGWPLSELWNRQIAAWFGFPTLLDAFDRVPSPLLNADGLSKVSPAFFGFCFGLSAAVETYGMAISHRGDAAYRPGRLGFDPVGLYPAADVEGQRRMELAEIKHGRIAMVAVVCFFGEEFVTHMGVIDEIPFTLATSAVDTV